MEIKRDSKKGLSEVFKKYASKQEDYRFSKTNIAVQLGVNPGETYISRSQAKCLLLGLEKFKHVILDFKRVDAVGQGFVDEVFRVFQKKHPKTKITSTNANKNVEFMIKRSLA